MAAKQLLQASMPRPAFLPLSVFVILLSVAQGSPSFPVNNYTRNGQHDPAVASLGGDKVVIVWESEGQDNHLSDRGVYAKVINAHTGEDILSDFRVNTHVSNDQDDPAVAAIGDDKFVVVWESDDQEHNGTGGNGVYLRVMSITGEEILPEFRVNNHTADDQDDVDVAVLGMDQIVIVWESDDQDGDSNGVYARVISLTGADILPEFRVNTYTHHNQADPHVASLGDNKFVVVWESYYQENNGASDTGNGVFARVISSNGEDILPEFGVNSHTADSQNEAVVAGIGEEKFVVVWESYGQEGGDDEYDGVFARVMTITGEDILPEFQVNVHTIENQNDPGVAAVGSDRFVVVWESYDQDHNGTGEEGVFVRAFDLTGAEVLPETQVNHYSKDDQNDPVVTWIGGDKFLVAWESYDQDLTGDSIFARIMQLPESAACEEQLEWSNCRESACCASGLVCYEQNEWYAQCLQPDTCESLYVHLDGSVHEWSCKALSDTAPACESKQPLWGNCSQSHCCGDGLVCYEQNEWYAQCLQPGTCGSLYGSLTGEYAWTCIELSVRAAGPHSRALAADERTASSLNGEASGQGASTDLVVVLGVGGAGVLLLAAVAVVTIKRRADITEEEAATVPKEAAIKSELAYTTTLAKPADSPV